MPEGSHSSSPHVSMGEESPRLSTASISSDERAPSATPSDSSDLPTSDRRPASLISTLSSGSGSSRDDNLVPPPSSAQSSDPDINLDLSPTGGAADAEGKTPQSNRKGRSFIHNSNNNNKERTASRASSRRQPASPFNSGSMAPNPQLTYLDRVVMEIIETERMYVRDLRMIVEDYLAHIIDQSDLSIRPEQVCSLFGNIEDIYEFNSELLQALDMCDNDPVAVARCFVMKSEYFEIYTQYCTNYPNSVAALTECMRNKSLAKFFRERQASLKRSLPLGSYLLKPVQRILKYHLLLQEIAKHFDPEEEGYEVVEEAIYTMTGVAWYINDMKRKHEHAVRLQEVQSLLLNWKGPDLTTYGELVLEGTFKVHRAKNERTLFLFDRMLLITKRRGEHYVYKTHISCSTLMLIESAKDSLSFSVTHYKHPKQPHTVQAKTVEEKKLWAHHIKRIILENHHAIIPQKAKEAILEMDSIYPSKYRYSPERLKKALSCQSDEFPRDARQGRRQSEPIKQMKNSKATLQEAEGDSSNKENGRLREEDESGGTEPTPEQPCADKLPQEKTSEPTENPEPELSSDLEPYMISASPKKSEELKPEEGPEPTEEPCSTTPDSDSKTLSSGESSEEEDDEKEAAEKVLKSPSILPSSVLDKASAIAQHFTNSIKRGSVAQDDARSLGCASPRLPSRTGSSVSLCTEPADRPLRLNSISSDSVETFGVTDLTMLSPRDDSLFDADRCIRRRRDSTLSKQDQLLIGKIKTYYENAENQDATFSLQRRESLTYIPTGLVRSSVSRFNSIPRDETVQTNPSTSLDPSSEDSNSALPSDHMVSSESLDLLKSDRRSTDLEDSGESHKSRSQSMQDNPSEDEDFRPSSEMIKIWQAMEREITRSQSDNGGRDRSREASRTSRATGVSNLTKGCDRESAASDLSTITEESTSPSPLKSKVSGVNRTGSLKDALKVFGEEAFVLRAPVPRVVQLRAESELEKPSEDSNQLDDVDMGTRKVLHLARQYSQRIKTSKPVVRQRSQGVLIAKKSLACVVEEESSGKPNLTLPLVSHKQSASLPLSPIDQIRSPAPGLSCSSVGGSRGVSPSRARSRSPLSPPPPIEGFNWPDVSELRSKYSDHSQKTPVGRSRSIPEQMLDGSLRRHSSCSSSLLLDDGASSEGPSYKPRGSRDASREEHSKRLHRANSLDPRLSGAQMSELQKLQDQVAHGNYDGYYIAAEAPLQNDPEHKIIVMEKLPEPQGTSKEPKEEDDDSYVQIRSPTSREKISIMAVIDRCRAYQESDEYKLREEAKAKSEPAKPQELEKTAAASTAQDVPQRSRSNSGQKTETAQKSIVKNLREKFQSLS
ncbi:pleckstrin homology domain-containing family G member 3 isoform X4 [Amphiprion ocellaris]|uniref:Pleckstrin homology and RhoGEF domain containing G3 n=2 Tax=Amphiprion ocellaris TaxID=80972 RepID=A0AAQ5ZZ76_AMPOC|nr:pleckstrin homology domain-containing family G member 3 isoform X4 [Amphiprion ocellaris]XP_054871931.1 pleckstrin homology domain-containing family G member 3 isoform X4 [Amphiprion ocellaris]XP_054871932.1 pleckstrin homology domain-containing family G member 3 isoform X4 [Amphiprion ocellaris]XP_054871933.1 pleckstrin homology domain-containing family G member 3 isoform X4 [Amphiprion ocellaris]XP_054871934.1 pleckstrin homology domain-containing family G member 3 isoform X4 [Amphiprion o